MLSVSGGTFNIKTTGTPSDATATSDGTSCKGLKAASTIEISGGEFTITSTDDSIHSNDTVVISNNPVIKITSNDDGIHADDSITVNGGDITITKSYEGIEAMFIEFNGGNVNITANDDGVNAAGGTDNSSMGRPGENSFDSTAGNKGLSITGGNIVVNAQGDGLDSNGNINVTGGTTVVYGPSGGGNGSFDYDGSATVSGGTVVAVGTSDMAQNFGSASTQCSILMKFNSSKSANTAIGLFDSNGNSIIGITTKKTTGCILVTAPQMTANQSYTFKTGGSVIGAVNGFAQGEGCYEGGTVICTTMPTNNIWNINESGMSTGDSGGMPGGSGGTRPTRRPQNTPGTTQTVSYTVEQVVSIMEQVEKQYEADGAIPMSVNDGISGTLNKASYFRLACMAVVNINSGNTSAAIQYKSFIEPQGIENDVFDYETISKAGYLDAAMRVVEYCDSRNAVPGSLPYPGQNNIEEYNGTLSYERAVGIMMKVLAYYGENRTLPESVEVALIGDATPTPQTTPTPDATPAVSPTATPSETVIPTETPDTTPTATPDNTPSSEEIVLAENSEYVIDRENTLLTNVSSSTTVLAFEENIEGEILIFDEQDNQITDKTAVIGTGYKLKLMDESGTVKDELTISVMGDLNGDGKENSRDIAALQKQLLSGDVVSAFVFAAADVKADAKINSRDIAELQKKILFG